MTDTFNDNTNIAQSNHWYAHIAGFDNLSYQIKNLTIPSVSSGETNMGTGGSGTTLYLPGDSIVYDTLPMEIFLLSDYSNHNQIVKWMKKNIRDPKDYKDIVIHLIDGNGNISIENSLLFKEAFPISISGILLDSVNTSPNMYFNVTFRFLEFDYLSNEFK
jgi:hypothetical protein